ncbi:hypothetical protein [Paraglaciecola sp.]|uniref:hypothetical protein n=1 Tax=Paraglaciecola sp. TaxID=1920173 RepID=UPI003EF4F962
MSSEILNTLTLKPVGHYRGLGLVFDVLIDDVSLLSSITKFEKRFDDKINGAYTAALGCRDVMQNLIKIEPLRQHFMPYACDCGE